MGMRMREIMLDSAERKKRMKKCKNADKYQGLVKPRCNHGKPCKTCVDKYETLQRDQAKTRVLIRKLSSDTPLAVKPNAKLKRLMRTPSVLEKGAPVKSYYGGEITEREKQAHERKITGIYLEAVAYHDQEEVENILLAYRKFVTACSIARPPYVTGTEKGDRRMTAQAGVAGEAGEVSNVIKKIMFRDHAGAGPITPEKRLALQAELGDLFWYFMSTCIVFDIDLIDDVIMMNMRKLVKRGR